MGHHPRGHGGVRAECHARAVARHRPRDASTARSCRSGTCTADEGPARHDPEKMAGAPAAPRGRTDDRGAVASQISDGAAALLVASEHAVRDARADARGPDPPPVVAARPGAMLTGPIPATAPRCEQAGLTIDDIDLFEVNEAFASWCWPGRGRPARPGAVNVNGGAIALATRSARPVNRPRRS